MEFSFIVNASVERSQGRFSTREDIEEQLIEALDSANPGSITGENDGEYEVTDWSVEDNNQKPGKPLSARQPSQPKQPAGPPLAPNLVRIIEAYVSLNALNEAEVHDPESAFEAATTELFKQLDILCERFPQLTAQAKTKLAEAAAAPA